MKKKSWVERILSALIITTVLLTVSMVTLLCLRLPMNIITE